MDTRRALRGHVRGPFAGSLQLIYHVSFRVSNRMMPCQQTDRQAGRHRWECCKLFWPFSLSQLPKSRVALDDPAAIPHCPAQVLAGF
ncbi:hypothetical protein GW17_00008377 [Ensete ventricosum]|nr:hypothetical protein GW17_00008377 [Ensete ventricosum]